MLSCRRGAKVALGCWMAVRMGLRENAVGRVDQTITR